MSARVLYRASLKQVSKFPVKYLRPKLRYNIRELFETYAHETDSQKVKSLIARGWKDLKVFKQLSELDEESIKRIFVS
ncbi:hypothetical protein EMCRGX_G032070 [Ephydatia muelleri]